VNANCYFCGKPVNPLARETWCRVDAWERKAQGQSRRGGSDIALRRQLEEFAHSACIRLEQRGVHVGQTALL